MVHAQLTNIRKYVCSMQNYKAKPYFRCDPAKLNDITRAWKTSNCHSINVKTMHNISFKLTPLQHKM